MIKRLPECIFWNILRRCDDIKTCVSLWCSTREMYYKYTDSSFWKNMTYYHFDSSTLLSNTSWNDTFWQNFTHYHGCSFCHQRFPKNKVTFLPNETVKLYDMNVVVCSKCKQQLGESLIHIKYVNRWQAQLLQRLHFARNPFFINYYGVNQINQCHNYQQKCIKCLTNVRNLRCQQFQCGKCCQCKFHKSHFQQNDSYHATISFDIYNIIQNSINHRYKKKRLLVIHSMARTNIVR